MVDEQLVAKHFAQSASELGGEGNFRYKVERLFSGFERVFDEVHVDGSLATRSHAVKQGDGLIFEASVYFGIGACLLVGEGGRCDKVGAKVGKAVHLALIHLKHATLACCGKHRLRHAGAFQQFVLGHLLHWFTFLKPVRKVEIRQQ